MFTVNASAPAIRAAGNFRPEIERQLRVCVADPRARIGIGAGAQGDAAEAILDELLGCKLERLDALAQLLNVRVWVQPQLAPQCSKRLDEVGFRIYRYGSTNPGGV